jgi:hypothetical protein
MSAISHEPNSTHEFLSSNKTGVDTVHPMHYEFEYKTFLANLGTALLLCTCQWIEPYSVLSENTGVHNFKVNASSTRSL